MRPCRTKSAIHSASFVSVLRPGTLRICRVLEGNRVATGTIKMLPRVLPVSRGDKQWYLDAARTGLLFGVASHRRTGSASSRSPVERFGQIGPRRHIFIHNGAPRALFDSYA
jgi:hypothetical protein